jgi:hypothetical protein
MSTAFAADHSDRATLTLSNSSVALGLRRTATTRRGKKPIGETIERVYREIDAVRQKAEQLQNDRRGKRKPGSYSGKHADGFGASRPCPAALMRLRLERIGLVSLLIDYVRTKLGL